MKFLSSAGRPESQDHAPQEPSPAAPCRGKRPSAPIYASISPHLPLSYFHPTGGRASAAAHLRRGYRDWMQDKWLGSDNGRHITTSLPTRLAGGFLLSEHCRDALSSVRITNDDIRMGIVCM